MTGRWMEDKVAFVTGAAGGIGQATARALAELGSKVLLVDLARRALSEVADELAAGGAQVVAYAADVTVFDEVVEAVAHAEKRWGRVDVVVSVAGAGTPLSLRTMTPQDWNAAIALNLTGPMNCILAAAPALRRVGGGSIVTVGSLAAVRMSMNNGPSYTAAKAGVLGLTRHTAFELARDEITVNVVLPGPVLTPQIKAKLSAERIEQIGRLPPIGRWVEAEEVANAILYFCSPLSRSTTGTSLIVDGGLHIGATSSADEYFARRDG